MDKQAFPLPSSNEGDYPGFPGMTLREYYAGQALEGVLSGVEDPNFEMCAQFAVTAADALLTALNAK